MPRACSLLVAVVLAACGTQAPAPTSISTDEPPSSSVAPREPGTIEDLLAYGRRHADEYGGLYVDPPGSTSAVMLFTANLELHRDAVNQILPGTRVREVAHTKAELEVLLESLLAEPMPDGVQPIGAALDEPANRVTFEVKTNEPGFEVGLELAHGEMLDVIVYPIPGAWADVESGEGWRLLVAGQAAGSEAYTVRAATDEASFTEMWEALVIGGDRPSPDFAGEVVVSFAHGISRSCPELRLDGVELEGGVVFSVTSDPLSPRACTTDLGGAAVFVVALARDALPEDGFTLRLAREPVTCGADCGSAEEIEVSLP